MKMTEQMKTWGGQFGKDYTDRSPQTAKEVDELYKQRYGITRSAMNVEFIGDLDKNIKILEVGSNVGTQLMMLQEMGFYNLYGIELQDYAVEKSKKLTKNINIIQGHVFDIPFKTSYFDLVFTSGVLIHISPQDIELALKEICRCCRHFIWGLEYYSENLESVKYRGHNDLLWKCDFAKAYLDKIKGLSLKKKKIYRYLTDDNLDIMFLLEKEG